MSRLTAAQVIALGEYLEPDFEPSSLTISQLLGVLGYHNVVYPTPYSKAKLVQVFNEEVKRKAVKFKRERVRKANSIASDEGITDGVTGEFLTRRKSSNTKSNLGTTARRSSRRLTSRPPEDEDEEQPARPDPPKRRRSSAQPRLGGSSKAPPIPVEPTVAEESEPEEEQDEEDVQLPVRKIGRTKKKTDVHRRVSQAEDSAWEDNNIFQSGAESSSPARPSPVRPKARRSSAVPATKRTTRKSMSAPPQASPPKERVLYTNPEASPPQSKFEPNIPMFRTPAVGRTVAARQSQVEDPFTIQGTPSPTTRQGGPIYSPVQTRTIQIQVDEEEEEEEEEEVKEEQEPEGPLEMGEGEVEGYDQQQHEEEETGAQEDEEEPVGQEDKQVVAVQKRIAEGGRPLPIAPIEQVKPTPLIVRLMIYLLLGLGSWGVYQHKVVDASIGYCDPASDTNPRLEELRGRYEAIEACNNENRTTLFDGGEEACPPKALIPFVHTCTPCPEHAVCKGHAIACEKPYVLRPPFPVSVVLPASSDPTRLQLEVSSISELLKGGLGGGEGVKPEDVAWKVLSEVMDGLPGVGSVGVPQTCVDDPRRKRHIGALGKAIEKELAMERGTRLCYPTKEISGPIREEDGGEAKRWGVKLRDLEERFRPQGDVPNFEDIFREAVGELVQWGGMELGEDQEGERWLAHRQAMMRWDCQLKVGARQGWERWRGRVAGLLVLIGMIYRYRSRRARRQSDTLRVGELVQVALDILRQQETTYHIDPTSVPHPYLSSLQLRDLVLQEEHDPRVRQRVWGQVEKVVEGNANVRASEEEVNGGEVMRVWRWVGATTGYATPGPSRRATMVGRDDEEEE